VIRKSVKITCGQLHLILETDELWGCIPISTPNNFKFLGTVIARGAGKRIWNIKVDILCSGITGTKLAVVGADEEAQPLSGSRKLDSLLQVEDGR
jgi:hypothetical protein